MTLKLVALDANGKEVPADRVLLEEIVLELASGPLVTEKTPPTVVERTPATRTSQLNIAPETPRRRASERAVGGNVAPPP